MPSFKGLGEMRQIILNKFNSQSQTNMMAKNVIVLNK